jgi:hypothetical protein
MDRLAKYIARQCAVCGLTYPTHYAGKNFRCPTHLGCVAAAPAKPLTEKAIVTVIKKVTPTHTLACLTNLGSLLKDKAAGY